MVYRVVNIYHNKYYRVHKRCINHKTKKRGFCFPMGSGESSESIRERVNRAREIQLKRYKDTNIYCNAQLTPALTEKYCALNNESAMLLKSAFETLGLSARAHNRILKVARTIADLEGSENIQTSHLAEAIQYRSLDKKFWFN